jgi:hypothetical protein
MHLLFFLSSLRSNFFTLLAPTYTFGKFGYSFNFALIQLNIIVFATKKATHNG